VPLRSADERLDEVVLAHDVRGTVPDPLDGGLVRALARAFAELVAAEGTRTVVVGHDMRTHSLELVDGLLAGVTAAGSDVVLVGLASTDQLSFASGHLDLPGVMVTASHNPAAYNGLKLCRGGARPVGRDSGLRDVRDRAAELLCAGAPAPASARTGTVRHADVLPDYAACLRALVPLPKAARRLRVVVDAGNAMAGHTVPVVLGPLAVDVVPVHFDLDGTFPHHDPNPLDPTTLVELQQRVVYEGADLGLAFDGDADRCFVVDERGGVVDPSVVTALIAVRALAREPGATVVHNLVCSRAVAEIVTEHGGRPVRTRVGHSVVKAEMARTGAVLGGEHSGHFYFRDFWCADSGMLAALHVLAALAGDPRPATAQLAPYVRYAGSGEVNRRVPDVGSVVGKVREVWSGHAGVVVDELDGLTVAHAEWWFNLRASHTEPLLRLNVEALDAATMRQVRDEVLDLVDTAAPTGRS